MTTGPNTGSRWTPRIASTPPLTILATKMPVMSASGMVILGQAAMRAPGEQKLGFYALAVSSDILSAILN